MSAGWHEGPLCAADLETTGIDVESDRVVTACVALLNGSAPSSTEIRQWLAWPGMDIPEKATAIHGVTTGHAREDGQPAAQVIAGVTAMIIGAAVAGKPVILYNAAYDLTLLDRQTRRYGLTPFGPELDAAKALIIDPLVIWGGVDPNWRGKRTLADAAARWGVTPGDAHTATGDALTAARVAWKIADLRPHVAAMSPTELHAWQVRERRRQADDLREWRRSRGRDTSDIDDAWPWRPWKDGEGS